jgi:hypothetical protein
MSKILYSYLVVALLLFTSCDNFLNETLVTNVEDLKSGFAVESNADQAMVAIYAELKNRHGLMGRNGMVMLECGAADLKITREGNKVCNYTFLTSKDDEAFDNIWRNYYHVIGRCNSAIELVPNTTAPDAKKSRYDSEAKVVRAIMYYYLMMYYQNCPLVLKTIQPNDRAGLTAPDATRDQIYDVLIADLEGAIANTNFPWEKNISNTEKGKVGQATARTLLTYIYLSRAWEKNSTTDFSKAKTLAKQVIDNGGYSLEPVLLDAYYKKFSKESIWELVCSNAAEGLGNHNSPWFAPLQVPAGADKRYYEGWTKMHTTQKLVDVIEDGDARRYLLAHGDGVNQMWAPKFLGGNKYGGPVRVIDKIKDNQWGLNAYQNAKGVSPVDWYNRFDVLTTATNWVVFRLSDVYLLYAEACIKTNDFDEARIYINKVRERARNAWTAHLPAGDPDIPTHIAGVPADIDVNVTGDALLAALKQERRVELMAEMKRMLDLRRWSLGGAKDLEEDVKISGTWDEKYKWYPKPDDQVRLSEGNMKQNDGF